MSKAYVLLSGGLDSTTLLADCVDKYGIAEVTAVSVHYGQKHSKELERAQMIAGNYGVHHVLKDLSQIIGKGGLSDPNLEVPRVDYSELEGVSPTYVPFRNGLLLSSITSMAAEDLNAEVVAYGAHAEDAANWAYPDCTPEFIGAMSNAIYIGSYSKIRLYTPFMWLTKSEIVLRGHQLHVPWDLTWSCYEGGDVQCGICSTCRARRTAFRIANVMDPTEYRETAA